MTFKKNKISFELICMGIAACFIGSIVLSGLQSDRKKDGFAKTEAAEAAIQDLPQPTKLLTTSKIYSQPSLKGIKINRNILAIR